MNQIFKVSKAEKAIWENSTNLSISDPLGSLLLNNYKPNTNYKEELKWIIAQCLYQNLNSVKRTVQSKT